MKEKIIIYDFDGTLTQHSLPQFEIIQQSGFEGGAANQDFLKIVKDKVKCENIDLYLALYKTYFEVIESAGFELIDSNFCLGFDSIDYNKGTKEFLEKLYKNHVKNYLLSSGLKVFLEKTDIAHYFEKIYATLFNYNEDNKATGIEYLMTDKNKVEAIKEILSNNSLNDCSNVIYIGDGLTDYYAMEYVKNNGGTSIMVYQD